MRISRARYVTICQQFLVTAVVLVVGLSAAGVMTLQIVSPESRAAQASGMAPAVKVSDAYADTRPVTPKINEVKVSGIDPKAAKEIPGLVTAPDKAARTAPTSPASPAAPSTPTAKPDTLVALTAPTPVHGYATVGVTWAPGSDLADGSISVQVRTMKAGVWSGWTDVKYDAEEGPADNGSEGGKIRPGTDPLLIGDVDQVQMKAETTSGKAPADLQLAVIDPGAGKVTKQAPAIDTSKLPASDQTATSAPPVEKTATAQTASASTSDSTSGDTAALAAMTVAPKPMIYSRAQWGANEALRDKSSLHYGTIQTGFIHHTVNANNYTADQVPALIRGIYAYHTQTRGWSDIGYNFLVDRFGRIWEGRYGGVDRPVVGAHTLGYNEVSFAMSAIGNYDIAKPPAAVVHAYASLFAWKLSLYNIRADASHLWVKNRYLYAINGHRDVGQTACPGQYLYAKIPRIRYLAQIIQDRAQTPADPVTLPMIPAPAGMPSPIQAPAPAAAQPAISFPERTSVVGSGWPDLFAMSANGTVQVVPTEGVADYTTRVVNGRGWQNMNLIAAVGDVTGDGKSDVLGRNARTGVTRVYPGDGMGHVGRGIAPTTAFARVRMLVGVRDFNKDRHLDVVGKDRRTGALLLYRGAGNGRFLKPIVLRKRWPFTKVVGVGDLNGDHQPDLVASKDNRTLYLFPGASRGRALGRPTVLTTLPAPANTLLGWGDENNDGRSDVLARIGSMTTGFAGTGGSALGQQFGPFSALAGLKKLTLAPMMGSYAPDAVGRDAGGHLVVVANNGLRTASAALPSNLTVAGASQLLNVGDWDRDGNADVVVRVGGGDQLVLYPGLGNGTFGRPRSLGTGWRSVTRLAAVGDVTGDGLPDLMGSTANGPMTIFPGAGTNGIAAPVLAPASMRTYNQIGTAPWASGGSVFASANGSFVPSAGMDPASALRMADGTAAPAYDAFIGVGDVNGDGVADLLARESGTGTLWLLPGKTSGGFAPRMWVANGYAGYQLLG
ncbi:MAG TPA: FG-GAP-like repeat-containing protein [Marmoricola sp.]|nr:FG-GAP-like repeat-containing protein [Marmoricola sp.]